MRDQPLTAQLRAVTAEADRLLALHRDALAYDAAAARLTFYRRQIEALAAAVVAARAAAARLSARDEPWGHHALSALLAAIRADAPTRWSAPGEAIASGGLDLLGLVAYTAASRARLADLAAQIEARLAAIDGARQSP